MDILKEKYFSIQFFNEQGIEKLSEVTGLSVDEIDYEFGIGNYLIGQTESGRYYFFSETDEIDNEITFNSFIRLVS
jgi:hypothetical protein